MIPINRPSFKPKKKTKAFSSLIFHLFSLNKTYVCSHLTRFPVGFWNNYLPDYCLKLWAANFVTIRWTTRTGNPQVFWVFFFHWIIFFTESFFSLYSGCSLGRENVRLNNRRDFFFGSSRNPIRPTTSDITKGRLNTDGGQLSTYLDSLIVKTLGHTYTLTLWLDFSRPHI